MMSKMGKPQFSLPGPETSEHTTFQHAMPWTVDRDSSVGIATRHGPDGPGIESHWGRDFPHPSGPALGPTQPPIRWVRGLSRG
jgi:hypothetical protein